MVERLPTILSDVVAWPKRWRPLPGRGLRPSDIKKHLKFRVADPAQRGLLAGEGDRRDHCPRVMRFVTHPSRRRRRGAGAKALASFTAVAPLVSGATVVRAGDYAHRTRQSGVRRHARSLARRYRVEIVVATRHKGSSDPKGRPGALGKRRRAEVARAGKELGVANHHFLDHADGDIENTHELRRELVAVVRTVRPDVVVCPDPEAAFFGQSYFNHRDHRVVGWTALDAVAPAAANPHYFPDTGPAHQVECVYLSGR